jgi:hypothetical protein
LKWEQLPPKMISQVGMVKNIFQKHIDFDVT